MKKVYIRIIAALAVCVLPVINLFDLIPDNKSVPVFTDKGKLEELTGYDVRDVEHEIRVNEEQKSKEYEEQLLREEEQSRIEEEKRLEEERKNNYFSLMEQLENGTVTYRQLFEGTLIVGDSLMHGLQIYGILDSASMITMVSASLYHLEANIGKIISINPERLILHYGINMLENSDSQLNWFIDMYRDILQRLAEKLPDTEIYVSGIFNVSSSQQSRFSAIGKYNERLSELCEETGVRFVDNSSVLPGDGSYYGSDGIHVSRAFYYDVWLPHMFYEMLV